MRVSWNVNGIRACVRHGFVGFVDRSAADIVGVQEVRAQPEDIPPPTGVPAATSTHHSLSAHPPTHQHPRRPPGDEPQDYPAPTRER